MRKVMYKGQTYLQGLDGVSDVLVDGVSKVSNGVAYLSQAGNGIVGEIKMFGGTNAPGKWLICDGSEVSKTTYALLYNVIGDMYGTASDSSKFVLPDFTGRTPIGVSDTYDLADTGGEEKHALTVGEMPSHTHAAAYGAYANSDGGNYINAGGISGSGTRKYVTASVNSTVTWQGATGGAHNAYGTAHNIMQPYLTVNFIIFAGV